MLSSNNSSCVIRLLRCLFIPACLFVSTQVTAVTVQATGQALIVNGDLSTARTIAINRARQQAALQANAFISTQQHLAQGVITQDQLSITSLANVGRAKLISEKISSNLLSVLISVDIIGRNQCSNGKTNNMHRKRIAIAAFPMLNPQQSKIGQLRNIESTLASELVKRLTGDDNIEALNAGHLMLQSEVSIAATSQLARGSLTTVLQQTRQLEVQYIVSGVVRDISMLTPSVFRQKNYFVDKYNKYDYLSSKYMRAFEVELFIHDGFTGALISQKSFRTAGLWGNNDRQKFGFASSPFWQLDYGKQVRAELDQMADEISATLRCNDFTVEISRTDQYRIWLKAGRTAGIKAGDQFDVYRKSTFYDRQQNPTIELSKTALTLTIKEVQANSASGSVNGLTGQNNIQSGDILISK
ncbi:MAG: hypothetical protein OFPI_41530 [Osedax symbiont Rs2]|nr:MAG: hypothetical protein OFPI_41530 [Osedax symbiont Rs2]